MAVDFSPKDVAGVLDQIYRAAKGRPQRFWLRSEELKAFASRPRSLRPEFFDQLALELELRYSILMSYPRLGHGGILGFASSVIVERWPMSSKETFQEALREELGSDWAQAVVRRLRKLYGKVDERDTDVFRPITISGEQLYSLADEGNFRESWWLKLLKQVSKADGTERFVFFYHGPPADRVFALTRERYIRKHWWRPAEQDWAKALIRYKLDETD